MELTHIKDLRPDPRNRRKHTPRNLGMLVDALHKVGAARSIVIDEHGEVLAGNGVLEAAAEAGITNLQVVEADGQTVVAVRRTGLSEAQKRELAIYDNRVAELAEWDWERLAQDQAEGLTLEPWFSKAELEAGLPQELKGGLTDPDDVPAERATDIKLGDLFELGKHRLLCGDSTKAEDVARMMDGEKADCVFTDPPYGMDVDTDYSKYTGSAKAKIQGGGRVYPRVIGDDADFDPRFILDTFSYCGEVFLWGADYYADKIDARNDGSWVVWDKRGSEDADRIIGASFELCWSKQKHKRDIARIQVDGCIWLRRREGTGPSNAKTDCADSVVL